ncbi:MAG: hypothetical protein M1820_006325 [Bogoriella megaspora]|nr:MAG: hypothetical protein M1820_006325 [Bogoriella megaspora]
MTFFSADNGAVNLIRLHTYNPGREESSDESLISQEGNDQARAKIRASLEESSEKDECIYVGGDAASRIISMPADRPINQRQLGFLTEVNDEFQQREMSMLEASKEAEDQRLLARLQQMSLSISPAQATKLAQPTNVHPQRNALAALARQPFTTEQMVMSQRCAARERIRSQLEYQIARDLSIYTDIEQLEDMPKSVLLHEFYEICQIPDDAHVAMLADVLGTDEDTIERWFEIKRQKTRASFVSRSLGEAPGYRKQGLDRENASSTVLNLRRKDHGGRML